MNNLLKSRGDQERERAKKAVSNPFSRRREKAREYAKTKSHLSQKDPNRKKLGIGKTAKDMLNPNSEYRGAGRLLQLTGTGKLAKRFINHANGGSNYSDNPSGDSDKLKRWFDEKWVDVKTGKPCGRSSAKNSDRDYPACRPSVRVNSDTPKTSGELSAEEKKKFTSVKNSGERIKYNHKKGSSDKDKKKYNTNVPSNPKLYNKIKSQAKKKFNRWPSAYASGWLVKEYKRQGGTYSKDSKNSSYSTLTDLEKDNLKVNGLFKEINLIEDCEEGICDKTKEYYDALDKVVDFRQRHKNEILNKEIEEESSTEKIYSAWELLCNSCNN
jgi:hypothetical protein